MKEAVSQLLKYHLLHAILDLEGPPPAVSACSFSEAWLPSKDLLYTCWVKNWLRFMSRIGQGREVLRRNLQMQICHCLQTGEFCSKFPALNPPRLWLCRNSGGVASPEPELPSQLIWCTSLQLNSVWWQFFLLPCFSPWWHCSAALFPWTKAASCASFCICGASLVYSLDKEVDDKWRGLNLFLYWKLCSNCCWQPSFLFPSF